MPGVDAGVVGVLWYPVSAARVDQSCRQVPELPWLVARDATVCLFSLSSSTVDTCTTLGSKHTGGGSTPVCIAFSDTASALGPPTWCLASLVCVATVTDVASSCFVR